MWVIKDIAGRQYSEHESGRAIIDQCGTDATQ